MDWQNFEIDIQLNLIQKPMLTHWLLGFYAERKGFEPSIELPLYQLSRRALSTTQAPLHRRCKSSPEKVPAQQESVPITLPLWR